MAKRFHTKAYLGRPVKLLIQWAAILQAQLRYLGVFCHVDPYVIVWKSIAFTPCISLLIVVAFLKAMR